VSAIALIANAVSLILRDAVRRLSYRNNRRWLWVPAFAGTTLL